MKRVLPHCPIGGVSLHLLSHCLPVEMGGVASTIEVSDDLFERRDDTLPFVDCSCSCSVQPAGSKRAEHSGEDSDLWFTSD